jgi:prepilin-type N-terminal cleavage/methylation domain-containing protein
MNTLKRCLKGGDDGGFGLIEIVVAMLMLAILALSLLPLLINGYKQSSASATIAGATQMVQQQMESVRSASTCTGLGSVALVNSTTSATTTNSRNVSLTQTKTVYPCPITASVLTGTVKVTSTVTRNDTSTVIASATTLVYVSGP